MLFRSINFALNCSRNLNCVNWLRTLCETKQLPALIDDKATKPNVDKLFTEVEIEVRGHDPAVLKSYMRFLKIATNELGFKTTKMIAPHYIRWNQWLLRASFAHKKVKLHYETRTHIRKISILHITGSTASAFLEYIQRNIPEGVGMKVTYSELRPLPPQLLAIKYTEKKAIKEKKDS
uniref:Small ribosomal subunit protein uS10m n=1 Tax=Acrobeloides nanus TaxID=290746 RepID=A0A914CW49_9BILA